MAKEVKKINANDLVDLINGIVIEAVAEKKAEWIAEQEAKQAELLESKVNELLKDKLAKILTSNED